MSTFTTPKGGLVQIIDDDHWRVPVGREGRGRHILRDFTVYPTAVRSSWQQILEASYRTDSYAQAEGIWFAARWLSRFQLEHNAVTASWDRFSTADWGMFTKWLELQRGEHGKVLAHDTRRCIVVWLIAAARHAALLKLPGTTFETVERLQVVSRQAFRNGGVVIRERVARRALSAEQYTDLLQILMEAWQSYAGPSDPHRAPADLPTTVACWLSFCDGVRPEEINTLEVEDVIIDRSGRKHELHLHAPNKDDANVPIDETTLQLLEALIRDGTAARQALGTRRLFVTTTGRPFLLRSAQLNYHLRKILASHEGHSLPSDLRLADGRKTVATHLASATPNKEYVRRILRHQWASTTETYYRAQQKVVVAGRIAKALQAEVLRLTVACQAPIKDLSERPEHQGVLARNPDNVGLPWGSCGRDIVRHGACQLATHCFHCPLFVPWTSKRHNFINERDEYIALADNATTVRERENRLYHANVAEAYIMLIDRRLAREEQDASERQEEQPVRRRRSRRPHVDSSHSPMAE